MNNYYDPGTVLASVMTIINKNNVFSLQSWILVDEADMHIDKYNTTQKQSIVSPYCEDQCFRNQQKSMVYSSFKSMNPFPFSRADINPIMSHIKILCLQ
jgi:hypothetical protein